MKLSILFLLSFFVLENSALSQTISKSFEVRCFSDNPKANGETDFKGETAVFNTDERVEYLKNYAEVAKGFFNDTDLDTKVVPASQLKQAMNKLKPQPEPEVRKRIPLKDWKWMGYKPGMEQQEATELNDWKENTSVEIKNEQLRFIKDDTIVIPIDRAKWRFLIEWKISGNIAESGFMLSRDGISVASLSLKGDELFINSKSGVVKHCLKKNTVDGSRHIKLEADLENGRYNVYIDEQLVADFIPLLSSGPVEQFNVYGRQGL
ncbi:MAG TPA: hypothetical protein VJ951_04380, partial [Bacteroidales bacterium]|nr:hypothetical protein [Bacteroidales bacterium]